MNMKLHRTLRGIALPLAVLVVWQASVTFGLADVRLIASPADVARFLTQTAVSGDLWIDLAASLQRNLVGFAIGALAGVATGMVFGFTGWIRALLMPSINTLKQVSIFAWVPLISIWFGLGEASRIFVIAFAVWFPVLFNTLDGIAGIPRELRDVARVFGLSWAQTIRRVTFPAALPSIFTGLYVGLIMSWMMTLGAEYMLTSTRGLGHMLLDGRENFRMDQVLAGCLVVGLVGYLCHAIADFAEHRLLGWRGPAGTHQL